MKRSEAIGRLKNVLIVMQAEHVNADRLLEFIETDLDLKPLRYIPSGCMHSMREFCNCSGRYEKGWDRETL